MMNGAHWHLLFNHIPVLGTFFCFALLLWAMIRKNESLKFTALGALVIVALASIPALATGEEAEEVVEHLPEVTKHLIHEHEELAEISFWVLEAVGGLALLGLILNFLKGNLPKILIWLVFIGSFAASSLMARASYEGGLIRHTELRNGVESNGTPASGHIDDDDD